MSRPSHLTALPGGRRSDALVPGRGHVTNLRPSAADQAQAAGHPSTYAPDDVRLVLTPLAASLVLAVLEGRTSQAVRDVGAVVRDQCNRRNLADDSDPTPAHGIPRPERGA